MVHSGHSFLKKFKMVPKTVCEPIFWLKKNTVFFDKIQGVLGMVPLEPAVGRCKIPTDEHWTHRTWKRKQLKRNLPENVFVEIFAWNFLVSMPDSEKYHWIVDVQSAIFDVHHEN